MSTGTIHYHAPWEPSPAILIDADGVAGRRIDPPLEAREVQLVDARDTPVAFASDGIAFVEAPTDATDFQDPEVLRRYEEALAQVVAEVTGAREVVIFDHTVRTDDSARPPARHAHGDYTAASARQRLTDVLGEERARDWAEGRFGIVNAWRPVGAPVERAPLAFARPDTVAPEDWVDIDIVYPDRRGRITGLLPSSTHEWVYRSRMTPDELAVFRVHDSAGLPAVAHAAVDLAEVPADAPVRRSVESRILVRL
jgi:hypothetical protein